MTGFAGPVNIKTWQTDSTVASIQATGATQFTGIVQTGRTANTVGQLLAHQFTTVTNLTSGASGIRLPAGAHIVDFTLIAFASAESDERNG